MRLTFFKAKTKMLKTNRITLSIMMYLPVSLNSNRGQTPTDQVPPNEAK